MNRAAFWAGLTVGFMIGAALVLLAFHAVMSIGPVLGDMVR